MNNKGVALLTVLIVMIIGIMLGSMGAYLLSMGNRTYSASRSYAQAFNIAQAGIEEAILDIENNTFEWIKANREGQSIVSERSGATYQIFHVFRKPLSGSGGAPVFPPLSGAYTGVAGVSVYYLIQATGNQGDSQADLYVMYIKEY